MTDKKVDHRLTGEDVIQKNRDAGVSSLQRNLESAGVRVPQVDTGGYTRRVFKDISKAYRSASDSAKRYDKRK